MPDENALLAHASFWDERYQKQSDDTGKPTHEWFRTFEDLEPFFERNLFQRYDVRSDGGKKQPRILHLGAGDSVCPLPTSLPYISLGSRQCWVSMIIRDA